MKYPPNTLSHRDPVDNFNRLRMRPNVFLFVFKLLLANIRVRMSRTDPGIQFSGFPWFSRVQELEGCLFWKISKVSWNLSLQIYRYKGVKKRYVRVRACACVWGGVCPYVWLLHPEHLIMRLVCAHIGTGHQICWQKWFDEESKTWKMNVDQKFFLD